MTEKRKDIYQEIKELTKDNPDNYLVSSLSGKLGLRGKFIRDEKGKLIPVLLSIKNPKPQPIADWGIIKDTSNGPKKESKTNWYQKVLVKGCKLLGFKNIIPEEESPNFAMKIKPLPAQTGALKD